jgi:hypothetical protein
MKRKNISFNNTTQAFSAHDQLIAKASDFWVYYIQMNRDGK